GEELIRLMTEQTMRQKLAHEQQMDKSRMSLEEQRLNETMRRNAFDESRTKRGDQIAEAEGVTSALDAGFDPSSAMDMDVSEADATKLAGTPQAARLRTIMNLTARPTDPAMAASMDQTPTVTGQRLAPTGAQQGQRRLVNLRRRVSGDLAAATTEEQRRGAAARAFEEGVSVPESLTKPTTTETLKLAEGERGRDFEDFKKRADYQEGQLRTRPAKPVRENLTPGQAFNATRALRNDFVRATQAAREVQGQFKIMNPSLDAVKAGAAAPGSQGVLVTFQKILDPTSVVRESEYARSGAGLSLLNRIEGQWMRIKEGGANVPVDELEKFVTLAEQFTKNQATAAAETKAQIDAIAEEYGIDPTNITREFGAQPAGGRVRVPLNEIR
ncbi:MAG: hypothetical protein Q8R78_04785, partial [Candidatus Omnitrophota bacterium]|nr:hypothetical protein [Candidatus Omnitrophota bacterium]